MSKHPTTWNNQMIKRMNKEMVLNQVMESAPLSRADIVQQLGLNKGTVSSLVNELIEEDLIHESGTGESSGGRRPVMLLFNEHAGYAIGIDIGVNYILGVVTNLAGGIVHEKLKKTRDLSVHQLTSLVSATIRYLMEQVPPSKYGVIGIGIGVPGIVDTAGKVLIAPNLKWQDVDLKRIIEKEFQCPIFIENEANAGAYGEKRFGAGRNSHSMIYVSIGIGIGSGVILNDELYRGSNGYSGENGHTTIIVDGKECTCGSRGCWEAYSSEFALLQSAEQHEHLAGASLEDLITLADAGNPVALELFQTLGTYIGIGIANLIKTYNPEQVIIGNRIRQAEHLIRSPIMEAVHSSSLPFQRAGLQINFSELSTYSAAAGVSAFAIEGFLKFSQRPLAGPGFPV